MPGHPSVPFQQHWAPRLFPPLRTSFLCLQEPTLAWLPFYVSRCPAQSPPWVPPQIHAVVTLITMFCGLDAFLSVLCLSSAHLHVTGHLALQAVPHMPASSWHSELYDLKKAVMKATESDHICPLSRTLPLTQSRHLGPYTGQPGLVPSGFSAPFAAVFWPCSLSFKHTECVLFTQFSKVSGMLPPRGLFIRYSICLEDIT